LLVWAGEQASGVGRRAIIGTWGDRRHGTVLDSGERVWPWQLVHFYSSSRQTWVGGSSCLGTTLYRCSFLATS
jgi:hypothetical protein